MAGTVETVNHVDDHKQARKDARLKTTLERPQPMLQPLVISRDGKPPQLIPDIVIDWNKDYKLWQVCHFERTYFVSKDCSKSLDEIYHYSTLNQVHLYKLSPLWQGLHSPGWIASLVQNKPIVSLL